MFSFTSKSRRSIGILSAGAAAALLLTGLGVSHAVANNLQWNPGQSATGGSNGTGTWNASTTNWYDSTAATNPVAWANGDGAYIGSTAASGSYTVTLDSGFTVGSGATTSPFNALTISGGASGTNYTLDGSGASGTGSYTLAVAGRIQANGNLTLQHMTVDNTSYTQSAAGSTSNVSNGGTLTIASSATLNGYAIEAGAGTTPGVINVYGNLNESFAGNSGGGGAAAIGVNSGGGASGSALNVYAGGTVTLAGTSLLELCDVSVSNRSTDVGTVNVEGGKITVQAFGVAGTSGDHQTGILNVDSGAVYATGAAVMTAKYSTNQTILNLNGGTFNGNWITTYGNSTNPTLNVQNMIVNFNGGTLQSHQGGGIGSPGGSAYGPTNLNVQTGGAFVDSNGKSNYWIQEPLLHDPTLGAPAVDGGLTVLDSASAIAQTTSTVTLQGVNTYTGPTTVLAGGNLTLGGAAAAANGVSLAAATIADSSSVTINSNAVLTLANDAAATQIKALNISGGTISFFMNSAGTPTLSISSAANVSGVNNINVFAAAGTTSFTYGTYNLISDSLGGLSGGTFQFTGGGQTAVAGPLSGGSSYLLTLASTDNLETLTVSAVPEPTALGLFAMGGAGLLLLGRKRKAQA